MPAKRKVLIMCAVTGAVNTPTTSQYLTSAHMDRELASQPVLRRYSRRQKTTRTR